MSSRDPREIISGETLVLAECDAPFDPENIFPGAASVTSLCISLQGRALLRLTKLGGSPGMHFRTGDTLQIECGFGLVLRGHSLSRYLSWKSEKTGAGKAVYRLEGIPEGQTLHSQTPFRLASVRWNGYYLGKEDSNQYQNVVPMRTSNGCLVLSKENDKKNYSQPMYLCALPARLSFQQDTQFSHIRDMFDRSFRRERCTQFAYVTQFRTVRPTKNKVRTVHMDKLDTCSVDTDADHFQEIDCSICLNEYEHGESVAKLPCHGGHMFHADCIHDWLKQKASCPMCVHPLEEVVTDTYNELPSTRSLSRFRRVASV